MSNNTTVTITYSNGETREFIASDELEKGINEGEMFSVTTMHCDISREEEVELSEMYIGNPIAAMGNMMMMKRNAENMLDGDVTDEGKIGTAAVEVLTSCIKFMADEISSHQSGMSPVENIEDDDCDIYANGDHPTTVEGFPKCSTSVEDDKVHFTGHNMLEEKCPAINAPCEHYECTRMDGKKIDESCTHNDNSTRFCDSLHCPLCTEGG
jgi:hypothetical protein